MTEKSKKYLSDILMAIELIEEFTETTPSFNEYESDLKTQSAVERKLAIIGEALNKISKEDPELKIKSAKQVIEFRNRLVHAYDSIDNAIVWAVLKKHIPELQKEIQELI